MEFKGCRT